MKNIIAAFMFFTRLPLWRIKSLNIPASCFKHIMSYWSLVGLLTSIVMALVLWITSSFLPYDIAILLALLSRVLLTGALHEDGLADFFDGFGGGTNRNRILSIMKDSHIGTYGIISILFYFALLFLFLQSLPLHISCMAILAADPFCKFLSSMIIYRLPYARKEEESKAKIIYEKASLFNIFISTVFGIVFLLIFLSPIYWMAIILPILAFLFLTRFMNQRIQGYTGDCCGALFLITELSFYLGIVIIFRWSIVNRFLVHRFLLHGALY